MNIKAMADELTTLLYEYDATELDAHLEAWRERAEGRHRSGVSALAAKARELKPMVDAGALSKEEFRQALELMLRLALDGGQEIR